MSRGTIAYEAHPPRSEAPGPHMSAAPTPSSPDGPASGRPVDLLAELRWRGRVFGAPDGPEARRAAGAAGAVA